MRHAAVAALEKLGQLDEAATALRALVEDATSPAARAALAALHVRLADQDFDGTETTDDLGRKQITRNASAALEGYGRALAIGVEAREARRIRERVATILEELGRWPQAASAWNEILVAAGHKERPALNELPGAEARDVRRWLIGRGRALLRAGNRAEARGDLKAAAAWRVVDEAVPEILMLLAEERFQVGGAGPFDEGVSYLRDALKNGGQAAQRQLAEAFERVGQLEQAAAEWRALVRAMPQDDYAPTARHRAAQALFGAGRFDDAVAEWNRFLSEHPTHPLWQQVRASIVTAAFAKGAARKEAQDAAGAIEAWRAFAQNYEDDGRAPQALLLAASALREEKDYEAALKLLGAIASRYEQTSYAPGARLLGALILEDDLGRLDEAIKAYEDLIRRNGGTVAAQQAHGRLERLRRKHLEVRMDRVLGAAPPPVLHVETRNIESVGVRVYRLGLEEYFARKGTLRGVENLQLEIVKPDWTSKWTIAGYVPHQLIAGDLAVPVKERGAYIVVAGDDDLTTTTLFVISDLECVVKKSPGRQLLVWAFDRTTHEPIAGARVMIPTHGQVGVTGKDGVWQGAGHAAHAGNVLVLSDRGAASTEIQGGSAVDAGFHSKAYVYTDRPVYRPGAKVSWRGIYLDASGGAYGAPTVREGRVELVDARGREVAARDVTSSKFGSFAGEFPIDALAPLGDWRIRLTVKHRGTWEGTFAVQEFRKPEFTVSVKPRQTVYLTGDEVVADLELRYAFGGAVADAPLQYEVWRLPKVFEASAAEDYGWYFRDERPKAARAATQDAERIAAGEVRTNRAGNAEVRFATKDRDDDAEYVVRASAMDVTRRWITDEDRIPVTRHDHMAVVKTDRRAYRPKQPVIARVRTMDARERSVARTGELVLMQLRRTTQPLENGRRGGPRIVRDEEVPVRTFAVTTDASGEAEVRLQLDEPGRFRLRWNAKSRGELVTAQAELEASGKAEDLMHDARLVPARTLYKEGENAEILLYSPVARGKALLTYEGELVLDYRFVDLSSGSMLLDLPLQGRHAPNVFFKIAIPGADRLIEAETEVVVLRHLDVQIAIEPAVALPGSEVEVALVARDANGKPVEAELGLALVDETVFAVSRDQAPPIRPYFYDRRRVLGVTSASSLGTRFYGVTRETSKDLLADTAARTGDASVVAGQSALRLAREALHRGDTEVAVQQVLLAMQADPQSWDARAMLGSLRLNAEADKAFKRLSTSAEPRLAEAESQGSRPQGGSAPDARKAYPPSSPAPMDGPAADDAPFEGASSNGTIGLGGGAGGAFRGRAGGRRSGSGEKKSEDSFADEDVEELEEEARSYFVGGEVVQDARFKDRADAKVRFADALGVELGKNAASLGWSAKEKLLDAYRQPGAAGFAAPEVRREFADTASWEPQVTTDKDGKATIKVKLPDNLTTWRATARGVSSEALVGSGGASVVARRNVLVRIDPPRFLTQGDQLTIPSVVHNNTEDALELTLRVKAEGIHLDGTDEKLTIPAGGRALSDRTFAARENGRVKIEAGIGAGLIGDAVEVSFGALARGIKNMDARSGTSDTSRGALQETFLELPEGVVPGTTRLTIMMHPGVSDAVLDAMLGLSLYPYGCVEQTVHRFLPALEAYRALQQAGSLEADRLTALREAAERGAARLGNLQNPDGSFGWFRGGHGDLAMTAYALRGLVAARAEGIAGLDRTIDQAQGALRRLMAAGDEDARALAHLALATLGISEDESYATSFRRRNEGLSSAGLAWMTMAAQRLQRGFDTDELVRLLLERAVQKDDVTYWPGRSGDCFSGSSREATALAISALIEVRSASAHVDRAMSWLLAQRGAGETTKEQASFVGAAAAYLGANRSQGFGGVVEVLLDGQVVRRIEVGARPLAIEDRRFLVAEAAALKAGRHALAFRLDGQGALHWAARLESVVTSEDLPGASHGITLARQYLRPEQAVAPGAAPPPKPGYTILREGAQPKVEIQELQVVASGDRMLVRLKVSAERDLKYVLVEDALPAGFEVLEGTTRGSFAWQERRDDRQVFFLTDLPRGDTTLEYVLQATHLGTFTALGTTAYAMYAPEVHGRGPGRSVRILTPEGARAPEAESGPTPDEVYAEARARFDAKAWDAARRLFTALRTEQPLRDEIVEEIEAYSLRIAIEQNDAQEIVRAREELVRRNPRRIPSDLDTARSIAFAYDTIGDDRVALGLYRDLIAQGFGLDADWMKVLVSRGRELEALDRLGEQLRRHPVTNATAAAAFERARRYRDLPRPEGRGGPAGKPMDEETVDALWSLTAHLAGTRMAPAANYALVEAQSRAGDLSGAATNAEAFLRRFTDSHYRDDAYFFLTDVRFRRFEQAPSDQTAAQVRAAAEPLVKEQFVEQNRRKGWSPFRERAFHVLGRVHHARGELEQAIVNYRNAHNVEDAREALAFLTEQRLGLDEIVMRPLAAGTQLPVRHRNVKEASFKAYPVDLQVLFAVRKTLEGLHRIDLSGIVPTHEWTATFSDNGDHAEHETSVALPMEGAAPGVWLVIAKAGSHEASSLVIKTDLDVVLQQVGDKVRVYATDAVKRTPVRGAYVTVSDGRTIRARGLTDGRGVFEAPGVGDTPFVVVSSGDRYAIARRR
ncbi:MAG: tetratricopeptide repeat protein [Planctomycetota bacterium]|nr:tetratricopeptide repeat protein [Planctomycetota bacterium]